MTGNYTIGLDIGTSSIGWAVIRDNYKVPAKKMKVLGNTDKKYVKKNLLGSLLFDEGQTAENTRLFRNSRRRLRRRRNRLLYLQEIFWPQIESVDSNFFHRLNESFFTEEDKKYAKHPIFGNLEDEVNYHEKFPTIYHLRQYIASSKDKVDIRLIYLAIAHIVKYRGHFLYDNEFDFTNTDIKKSFSEFITKFNQINGNESLVSDIDSVENILTDKTSKTEKFEKLLSFYPKEKKTGFFAQLLKLSVGNQANFKSTFSLDEDAKLKIMSDSYEEDLEELLAEIGDEYQDLFDSINILFNAVQLAEIVDLKNNNSITPLSDSMVQRYIDHKTDLRLLKNHIKEHCPDDYHAFFNSEKDNGYAGYINGSTSEENYYKKVKK